MRCQPSGKIVKDMVSHLQLPGAERIELYTSIQGVVEGASPADRKPELALCKKVRRGQGRRILTQVLQVVIITGPLPAYTKSFIWHA